MKKETLLFPLKGRYSSAATSHPSQESKYRLDSTGVEPTLYMGRQPCASIAFLHTTVGSLAYATSTGC